MSTKTASTETTMTIDFDALEVPIAPQPIQDPNYSPEIAIWQDASLSIEERDAARCAYFMRNNYIQLQSRPGYAGTGLAQFARRGDNRHCNMTTGDIYRFQTREVDVTDAKGQPTGRTGFVLDIYNAGRNGIEFQPAMKLAEVTLPNGEPFPNRSMAVSQYHPWCTAYENGAELQQWLNSEHGKAHLAKREAALKEQNLDRQSLLAKRANLITELNRIKMAGMSAAPDSEERVNLAVEWGKVSTEYKANEEAIKDLEAAF